MVILAGEDIGLADPRALQVAVAAFQALEFVGLPEAPLRARRRRAIYLALAPKSNAAARAIGAARGHIREHGPEIPPAPLRSAAYPGAASLGRGRGYRYPHEERGHVNDQEHFPEGLESLRFYEPDELEGELRDRLERIRRARGR